VSAGDRAVPRALSLSRRSEGGETPNALTLALRGRRERGEATLDLTVSNPTTAGIPYAADAIRSAFATPSILTYAPLPFGTPEARRAVAESYEALGVAVSPERVVVTASTSEAYSILFKVLCDPGDEVLVPAPSYPLFDWLARLENVSLVPYRLRYDGAWHVDRESVVRALSPRTRATIVVSPNNPTGSYLSKSDLAFFESLAVPIVSDEVFATYPLDRPKSATQSVLEARSALVFSLGGLSKHAALPQMKAGWIGLGGPDADVARCLERLELVMDTFLSVGTPVLSALPSLLATHGTASGAIRRRTRANLDTLTGYTKESAVTLLAVEGGWSATLRLPNVRSEEAWTLGLLHDRGVYVHPGHFFDFEDDPFFVVSLLTPEADFARGAEAIVRYVAEWVEER